jgi:hypothetical protein
MADFPLPTYSFLDVYGSINGPGFSAQFGNGSGQADEGITIVAAEETNRMTPGASGEVMHTLVGVNAGRLTIHVLKTSQLNFQLNAALAYQRTSSLRWGQNTITITNPVSGDHITCKQVAFTKQPDNSYAKEAAVITWEMEAGHVYTSLGGA